MLPPVSSVLLDKLFNLLTLQFYHYSIFQSRVPRKINLIKKDSVVKFSQKLTFPFRSVTVHTSIIKALRRPAGYSVDLASVSADLRIPFWLTLVLQFVSGLFQH